MIASFHSIGVVAYQFTTVVIVINSYCGQNVYDITVICIVIMFPFLTTSTSPMDSIDADADIDVVVVVVVVVPLKM